MRDYWSVLMAKQSYTEVLVSIEKRLSSIETATQYQENHLRNINGQLEKQNKRIGKNEKNIAKVIGIGSGVAFMITLGIALAHLL